MSITKPHGYDQFIALFDPVGLTGLGSGRDDTQALLWALMSGDLARRYQNINTRLSWLVLAVEQFKQLRASSSWTVKIETMQRLFDSESFMRLLSYGLTKDELQRLTVVGMRAFYAHRSLQSRGPRSKSPAVLRRRRRKMYQEFVHTVSCAVESGIRTYGKRIRA